MIKKKEEEIAKYRDDVVRYLRRAREIALELFSDRVDVGAVREIYKYLKQGASEEEVVKDLRLAVSKAQEVWGAPPTPEQAFLVFEEFFVEDEDE